MSRSPQVIILRTAGTNCSEETAFAFKFFGAKVEEVHINELVRGEKRISNYHILAVPGGFSYGDDIASGKILANELRLRFAKDIAQFKTDGKLMIGICNGFQILTKAGILPGLTNGESDSKKLYQEATLTTNDSAKFEDRWVYLQPQGKCVWTQGITEPIYLPVAHAEGKFIPKDNDVLNRLKKNGQVIFRYASPEGTKPVYPQNPNGSVDDIAGICDATGRILGLMPHPERHLRWNQHPSWTRLTKKSELGDGAKIFENGVNYVKKNLLSNE